MVSKGGCLTSEHNFLKKWGLFVCLWFVLVLVFFGVWDFVFGFSGFFCMAKELN